MLTTTKYRILFSVQIILEKIMVTANDRMLLGESFTLKVPAETELLMSNFRVLHRIVGDRLMVFLEVQPLDDIQMPQRFIKDEPKIRLPDGTRLRFFLEFTNSNIVNKTNLKEMRPLRGELFYFSNKTGKKVGTKLFLNQNDVAGVGNIDRKTKADAKLSKVENPFGVIDIWHDPANVPTDFRLFNASFISNENLLFQLFFKKS